MRYIQAVPVSYILEQVDDPDQAIHGDIRMANAPNPDGHSGLISSATLPRFRNAAIDAVWRCGLHPIGMEQGSARAEAASEVSHSWVRKADVYVGIFAHRYGETTEKELRWAEERK